MAKTLSNVSTQSFENLLKQGVSEGVMSALAARDAIESAKAEHEAMLAQHVKVVGEGQDTDPMSKVSDNIEAMRQNQDKLTELFASMSQSLSMMNTQQGSPMVGSSLASQATASSNEMTLTSSTPMNTGTVGSAFKNFAVANNSVSAQAPTPSPVDSSQGYQEAMTAPVPVEKENYEESNKKAQAAEEDRLYKEAARPVMPKLSRALDMYLEGKNSSTNNGGDSSTSLAEFLAALAGGAIGFAFGYLGKFAEMWKTVGKSFASGIKAGWDKLRNSKIGKKVGELGTKLKNAVSGGIQKVSELGSKLKSTFTDGVSKIGELKSSFMSMLSNWKKSLKESAVGKAAGKVADTARKVGGFFKSMATSIGSKISGAAKAAGSAIKSAGKAVASGAKVAAKAVANSGVVKAAVSAAKTGAKLAKKFPLIQAAAGIADTAVNTYKVVKAGGGVTDVMSTVGAGLVDTLADTLLIPEIVNSVGGAVAAAQSGKGIGGILKGAGSGFMTERDANDISIGTGLMANVQNFVGNETETTRRVADAYNKGLGYDAAGVKTVSGAAGGFGHSAALYVPKAAGSMENSKAPTATVVPNLPDEKPMSEADRLNAIKEGVREGMKEATLSPEVQEANARNAKEAAEAMNGKLFGG